MDRQKYFAAGYKKALKDLAQKSSIKSGNNREKGIQSILNEAHDSDISELAPFIVKYVGDNDYNIKFGTDSFSETYKPDTLDNMDQKGKDEWEDIFAPVLEDAGFKSEYQSSVCKSTDENGVEIATMIACVVRISPLNSEKAFGTSIKTEHATEGKDQIFTDMLNENRNHIDVMVSARGGEGGNYVYTIRLVDRDIKGDVDHLIDLAEEMWTKDFEPILSRTGYETKQFVSNIDAVDGDKDGTETLLNINFMVKEFPEGTTFTRSFSKSIKSSGDDVNIESESDLNSVKSKAQDISEKWVETAWKDTPKGSTKKFDYLFTVTPFDIEYKCTVIIEKYDVPDAWADGNISAKWDDEGNGWPRGIGKPDISGEILVTVGEDDSKHPPYGVLDGATQVQYVIEELCKWYPSIWASLEDSDAKSIRSIKSEQKYDTEFGSGYTSVISWNDGGEKINEICDEIGISNKIEGQPINFIQYKLAPRMGDYKEVWVSNNSKDEDDPLYTQVI